jgi:hypothetical protein
MTMNSRDDRSELHKLLADSIKYDWEVEFVPAPPTANRNIVDEMLALLPKSKAPYKSRL